MYKAKSLQIIFTVVLCAIVITNFSHNAYGSTDFKIRKDTPADFNAFLDACTQEERVQLLQSLKDLPSLKDVYFGLLDGLPPLTHFTTEKEEATEQKPLKPKTFNEVPAKTVVDAVRRNILPSENISSEAVRKALVYRSYNKMTYYFRGHDTVDYHAIVQWAARKNGITKEEVGALSSFTLEKKIIEKYFEKNWDQLTIAQRTELLAKIEKETGSVIANKEKIAKESGAMAIPSFKSSFASNWFSDWVSDWIAGAFMKAIMMSTAEEETVSVFIMNINLVKAKGRMR